MSPKKKTTDAAVEMPKGEMMPGGHERPVTSTGRDQMPGEWEGEYLEGSSTPKPPTFPAFRMHKHA